MWYHVLNRGNRREEVFHKPAEYDAFVTAMADANESLERVNEALSLGDLQRLRTSVERGRPYGDESWTNQTARRLGLESTLRSRGRPRKSI